MTHKNLRRGKPHHSNLSPLILLFSTLFLNTPAFSQTIENVTQGAPGTLINGPIDPDMGRLSTIEYLGGYVITIPENPGSEPGDHRLVKAWDLSNLNNPVAIAPINPDSDGHFGGTRGPFLSHGAIKRDNELLIFGFPNSAVRINANGTLEHAIWSGPDTPSSLIDQEGNTVFQPAIWWSKSGMMRPWAITDDWEYNTPKSEATMTLGNKLMAQWNIGQDTGVTGFGHFMGNLLIYASDQRNSGLAVYDASDVSFDTESGKWKPKLLDTLNTPTSEGGLGGYWSEISGHYLVFARAKGDGPDGNANFTGIQIVDFSDPSDLKLHCNVDVGSGLGDIHWTLENNIQYLGFQDEYVFADKFKINIETCEIELTLDAVQGNTGPLCYQGASCPALSVGTNQYSRIIGNLWLSGGYPNVPDTDGMAIWVHQSAPDTNGPYIAYHIPQANQTNYPPTVPLSFSIPETLRSQTVVVTETAEFGETETLTLTEVDGNKVDIDYVLSHSGMLTVDPVNDLKPNTTYEVAFTSGILDAAGNPMTPYSFRFSTGNDLDGGGLDPAVINNVNVSPSGDLAILETVTVTISSNNATEYQLTLDGESIVWQSSPSRSFNFDQPGEYFVNAVARNSDGTSTLQRVRLNVVPPVTNAAGKNSAQLVCDVNNAWVWTINQDNDSLSKIDAETNIKLLEIVGPDDPQSVALSANDEVWVSARNEDLIYIYDQDGGLIRTLDTGYGSAPMHVLASNDGNEIYVTLYGDGAALKYDIHALNASPERVTVGPSARAMALSPDGNTLLVTRFISAEQWGEVYDINVNNWTHRQTYRLDKNVADDQIDEGRGIPNYLSSVIITSDGKRAFVVGKKDNIDRGLLNGIQDLDEDNTVRTIAMVLDLNAGVELREERLDFDNASSPSALAISADNQTLFVGMQGKNSVVALGLDQNAKLTGAEHLIPTGLAPQGLCVDSVQNKLFVKNFTERTLSAVDLSNGLTSPDVVNIPTVSNEKLSPNELAGLQIFYNAFNGLEDSISVGKMSSEGYISCAECHLDGGHDGRTYDFTGRNEGMRNNISLKGRGGTRFGNVHWSSNFDEIHDFEHDIRNAFGGRGLMTDSEFATANTPLGVPKVGISQDLDNLAAYVATFGKASLPRSPFRSAAGNNTASAIAGRQVYEQLSCTNCHRGTAFTDKDAHDVGTLRSHSGSRLGEVLTSIKTPSLLGAFDSAPYLHDGSARTIADVFNTVGGVVLQAEDAIVRVASVITQTGYSYLRGAAGVRFVGVKKELIRFKNVDGGSGGTGKIRIRYGSTGQSTGNIRIRVNRGAIKKLAVIALPQVEGQDVAFTESSTVDINLDAGSNKIKIKYDGADIIIDEITVSNVDNVAAAQAHHIANTVSANERSDLINYLLQIDQAAAPENNETDIFGNAPTVTNNDGDGVNDEISPINFRN